MQNKLQELTDKLYQEGLAKGKAEGDKYLEDAKLAAQQIVEEAKAKAQQIEAEAIEKASALSEKASSDIKMASAQALQATKKDIEDVLLRSVVAVGTSAILSDESFLKEIVSAVAHNFSTKESQDLALVLPASLQAKLEPWVSSELSSALSKGVQASFSKKIKGGFTIGPADGSWYVSLTEETFSSLIQEYLRPVTKKLLFGE